MSTTDLSLWARVSDRWPLLIGISGMLLLVAGTFLRTGATIQRWLFLVGAVTLGITAYANDERMLTILQAVISLGAVLAFVQVPLWAKLAVLCGAAVLGIGSLVRDDYITEDRWWPIGGIGLGFLAVAFAISGTDPFYFNVLVVIATALVLIYNLLSFAVAGVRLQAIWIILNAVFILNPARRTLTMLGIL